MSALSITALAFVGGLMVFWACCVWASLRHGRQMDRMRLDAEAKKQKGARR